MIAALAGVALAAGASGLFNAAIAIQALEARAVSRSHALRLTLLARLVRRPRWLGGAALTAAAWPLQTLALVIAPLTVVQPADGAGLILLLFLGARMLGERVGRRERLATLAIVAGVAALAFVAPERGTHQPHGGALAGALALLALGALLPYARHRLAGRLDLGTVIGAGCAFAWTAFATKLIADHVATGNLLGLAVWIPATAVAGVVGMLTEMSALQARPATRVAPIIFVLELLIPVSLGWLVGGERLPSHPAELVTLLAALAAVTAGVGLLGRSSGVAELISAGAPESRAPRIGA